MAVKNKVLVLAGLLIPFFAVLLMSHNTFAADSGGYNQATVDFHSNQQIQATVNLPWNVNPGNNWFFLNNLYFNNTVYTGTAKSFISGRFATDIEIGNALTASQYDHIFICGLNKLNELTTVGNTYASHCNATATIVYSDNTSLISDVSPVFVTYAAFSPNMKFTLYFDFSKQLDGNKTISFIQFRFFGQSGYDVFSYNTTWNNNNLMILVSGRSTIETYSSSDQMSNALLQTQINQNQAIINQNNQYYSHEYQAETNIQNQSSSDIPNASDQKTTSLIGFLGDFVGAIGNINTSGDCSINLTINELPDGFTYNQNVNPCIGKDKFIAGGGNVFFEVFLPIVALLFYLPFVIFILRLIYKEIRSFTD